MKIVIYKSKSKNRKQLWGWRMVRKNGRIVAVGGEGFSSRRNAYRAAAKVIDAIWRGTITYV